MALIRYAEGQQRSGNLGATVYSHNRYGAYLRPRTVPVNPNTKRQVDARNRVKTLTVRWQNVLTQSQRDAWDLYGANVPMPGRMGTERRLTGLNHYVRTNTIAMQANLAIIDDAPVIFTLAGPENTLGGSSSEATQQLTLSYDDTAVWADEDGAAQLFYQGRLVNSGIKFFGGPYRYIGVVLGNSATPPTSPEVLTSAWPFAANQRQWVRSRIMRADGRLSGPALASFLASA